MYYTNIHTVYRSISHVPCRTALEGRCHRGGRGAARAEVAQRLRRAEEEGPGAKAPRRAMGWENHGKNHGKWEKTWENHGKKTSEVGKP